MFIYTLLLVKTSLLFHKLQFSFACFLTTVRQYISSQDIFIGSWKWLVRMFTYCFDRPYYEGNHEVSLYCFFFLVCKKHVVGHCWCRNLAGSHNTSTGSSPDIWVQLFVCIIQSPYHCQWFDMALHFVS